MKYIKILTSFFLYFLTLISLELLSNLLTNQIALIIINILSLLLLILILSLLSKIKFSDFKFKLKDIFPTILSFTLFTTIIIIITTLINNSLPTTNNQINILLELKHNSFITLTKIIILFPIIEELLFRYSFRVINNDIIYTLLSSTIFALLHLSNLNEIIYFIPYFLLGFMLSYIYTKTKSLSCSIISHSLYNLIILTLII